MTRRTEIVLCALALTAAVIAAPAHAAGLFGDLKKKAADAAKRKAAEVAKEKVAEVLAGKKLPDPPAEPADPFMGEYVGTCRVTATSETSKAEAKVVGYVDGKTKAKSWDVVLTGASGVKVELKGAPAGEKVALTGAGVTGEIADGKITAKSDKLAFALSKHVRKSPTLGAKPPAGAVVLLPYEDGKAASLDEWTNPKWVPVSDGSVLVRGGSNLTKREFGSFKLHVEFYCPYMPTRRGQGRANSGCYMHGRYEVQVLDSFGLKGRSNEAGGIYGVKDPDVNAALPPGQWQTYDITFQAPKLGADGKVLQWPKFVEVLHNGIKVQENVEVKKITTAGKGKGHPASGPIMLQDHGNPVRFRNMWLVETK